MRVSAERQYMPPTIYGKTSTVSTVTNVSLQPEVTESGAYFSLAQSVKAMQNLIAGAESILARLNGPRPVETQSPSQNAPEPSLTDLLVTLDSLIARLGGEMNRIQVAIG